MKVQDSLVVSRLPQFLIDENTNSSNNNKELLESLNPNTINITAALIDGVIDSLQSYNQWNDITKYQPEFQLQTVLGDLIGSYAISQPELLKGFFKTKGTLADINYVLKNVGYNLNIYEADYYYQNLSILDILNFQYPDIMANFIAQGYTEAQMLTIVNSQTVRKVNNNIVLKINNNTPIKVINTNVTAAQFFSQLGYIPNDDELNAMASIINAYVDAQQLNFDDINCTISADVTVNLDYPGFSGVNSTTVEKLLNLIVANRLSICTSLRQFKLYLAMSDTYVTKSRLNDTSSVTYQISTSAIDYVTNKETVEDLSLSISTTDTLNFNGDDSSNEIDITRVTNKYGTWKIGNAVLDTRDNLVYSGKISGGLPLMTTSTTF